MKAIFITQHGDSTVLSLGETEKPVPAAQEVLIKVSAIGVNYADILVREGVYPVGPLPAIAGAEVTGIIETVGSDVKHLQPGQKISGIAQQGYAEFAILPASQVFPVPDQLPAEQALIFQALTACHLLDQSAGYSSLLVTAAAGGIGSMVVQIARYRGIQMIIGMTGNVQKEEYVKSLGATHTISYQDEQWPSLLQQLTAGHGVNLILDAVGGPLSSSLVRHLAPGGKMVVFGNSSGSPSTISAQDLIWKSNTISGATIYAASMEQKQLWLQELMPKILEGCIRQTVHSFPLSGAAKAQDLLKSRSITGRVALLTGN